MKIIFSNKKLEKYAEDEKAAVRKLGSLRADLYLQRLGDLAAAETLEDVRYLPGKYHELEHNRKGQWACSLDQPYRLIFEPIEKPIPTDPDGKAIWIKIKGVDIVEINDYHKER